MRVLPPLAVLIALSVTTLARAQQPTPTSTFTPATPPQIVTTAQGESRVVPDRATIFMGVETRAPTAAQASSENARRQRAVIDTLRAMGIPTEHISTTGYNVVAERVYNPQRGDAAPRITGYVVTNMVRVEVRRIEQVGQLIDATLAKGANNVGSLEFYSSVADSVRRIALSDAITRARTDAQAMARAAGGQLGELLELSFTPHDARPYPTMMAAARTAAAQDATPITPGEQTLTVSVVARWRFISGAK